MHSVKKKTGLHRETGLGQRRKTSNLFQIDHNGGEKPAWEENHQEENQNREGGKNRLSASARRDHVS